MSTSTFSSILRVSRCIPRHRLRVYSASSTGPNPTTRTPKVLSSCEAETVLKGVNYLKGQSPVVALPDEEYPEWLWNVLSPRIWPDDGPGGRADRAERRKANKQKIRDENFMSTQ
ncbi:putative mitochondrial ribosome protein mrpl37p [Mycena indigotica]|uniref:Large ribosomal subunit protein mL54 n=1 Tax=Mycena indigotica TaxID=2126181 RepID=A0A8H6S120_9AGAR|nr:putative mitochondrial ribosome protein mrpl37p [Mycena indigotica]KAF7289917.1 putative mitochondrial ribosome protein mrpl37p [Mycena indigotica]